jgi:hypothetical protein
MDVQSALVNPNQWERTQTAMGTDTDCCFELSHSRTFDPYVDKSRMYMYAQHVPVDGQYGDSCQWLGLPFATPSRTGVTALTLIFGEQQTRIHSMAASIALNGMRADLGRGKNALFQVAGRSSRIPECPLFLVCHICPI